MDNNRKKTIYGLLLALGLITFILQIFIFSYPDGFFGLIICIISTELILISTIKLYKMSDSFKESFKRFIDILFRIH